MFKKAVKHEAKLRLSIAGPSGSGKTYTSLAVASELGDSIAYVDTEHGSASKYADLFDFDVLDMDAPFHPNKFVEAIREATKAGYDVIVLDSLTHAWSGTGGVLHIKEDFAKQREYNDYTAWGPAGEIHQKLIDAIVSADIHVIATMRSKMKYAMEEYQDRNGNIKSKPVKVGMGAIQKEGMEYEFDIALDMDDQNNGIVQKTRCPQLAQMVIPKPGKQMADILKEWLSGVEPEPEELPYEMFQEVMVIGKSDEKLGEFLGMAGKKLLVKVDGKEFPISADRVQAVGSFLKEELPDAEPTQPPLVEDKQGAFG